ATSRNSCLSLHDALPIFRCKCGCGRNEIQEELVDKLDKLRGIMRIPFRITSGFRCPVHNEKVSSTGRNGPHTTGFAADILLSGRSEEHTSELQSRENLVC